MIGGSSARGGGEGEAFEYLGLRIPQLPLGFNSRQSVESGELPFWTYRQTHARGWSGSETHQGVVVATLLEVLGVPRESIVAEYKSGDGGAKRHLIEMALDGITPVDSTFDRIDLQRVRQALLGP